jgi:hypothetical protein
VLVNSRLEVKMPQASPVAKVTRLHRTVWRRAATRRGLLLAWSSLVLATPGTAWAAAGEPDPTFGSGGVFSHEFAGGGQNSGSELQAVALATGGTIEPHTHSP